MALPTAPRTGVAEGDAARSPAWCSSLVLALLVGLSVAVYNKAFTDVVHVTLQTDQVGNQLSPPPT